MKGISPEIPRGTAFSVVRSPGETPVNPQELSFGHPRGQFFGVEPKSLVFAFLEVGELSAYDTLGIALIWVHTESLLQ